MPTYQFNPHRHVKIWFSGKPHLFMNYLNKQRLTEMRDSLRHNLLALSVIKSCGPAGVSLALFPKVLYSPNKLQGHIQGFSLEHYKLEHHFFSLNNGHNKDDDLDNGVANNMKRMWIVMECKRSNHWSSTRW